MRTPRKGGTANVGCWVRPPAEDAAVALAWGEADALTAPEVDALHDTAEVWEADTALDVDVNAASSTGWSRPPRCARWWRGSPVTGTGR